MFEEQDGGQKFVVVTNTGQVNVCKLTAILLERTHNIWRMSSLELILFIYGEVSQCNFTLGYLVTVLSALNFPSSFSQYLLKKMSNFLSYSVILYCQTFQSPPLEHLHHNVLVVCVLHCWLWTSLEATLEHRWLLFGLLYRERRLPECSISWQLGKLDFKNILENWVLLTFLKPFLIYLFSSKKRFIHF